MTNLSGLVAERSEGRGVVGGALVCFLFSLATLGAFQARAGTESASGAYLSGVASPNRPFGPPGGASQPLQGQFTCAQQGCQTGVGCADGAVSVGPVAAEIQGSQSDGFVVLSGVKGKDSQTARNSDFKIRKSVVSGTSSDFATFEIDVTNFLPHQNVVVTDTLPNGLTLCAPQQQPNQPVASVPGCLCPTVPPGWTWSIDGQTLTFCLPNWPDTTDTAAIATFRFSVSVADFSEGDQCGETTRCWTNTAMVTACNPPPPPIPVSDLSIKKTGPSSAIAGSLLTYTITASNGGPSDAPAVTVTDTLPVGLTISDVKSTGSGDVITIEGNLASVQIPLLKANSSETITVTAIATCPGTIVDTATIVSGSVIDNVASNNSATVQTLVSLALVATPAELNFPLVEVSTSPSTPSHQSLTFQVENSCASPFNVFFNVTRVETPNEFRRSDVDTFFSISDPVNGNLDLTQPVTIPGGGKTFTVTFAPAIPRFTPLKAPLAPADVLPASFFSVLSIALQGGGVQPVVISLAAGVAPAGVQFANPAGGPTAAVAQFTGSGTDFELFFYVYQNTPEQSIGSAVYELLDSKGNVIPNISLIADTLGERIDEKHILAGRTFQVKQPFKGDFSQVAAISVTLFGKSVTPNPLTNPIVFPLRASASSLSSKSRRHSAVATVELPVLSFN